MVVLALRFILVLLIVKANLASPSTEARFKDEAKRGETQESHLSLWITKYMTKIKTVVLEKIEEKVVEINEELAFLKEGLISDFDAVITDVKSRLKGTVYQSKPCTLLHFGKIYSS